MTGKKENSLYMNIVLDIYDKLLSGFYEEDGNCLPSRAVLRKAYHISGVTASRVQAELLLRGMAYNLPGKGLFGNVPDRKKKKADPLLHPARIDRIVILSSDTRTNFSNENIKKGIRERCGELGIPVRFYSRETDNKILHLHENEGMIIPYWSDPDMYSQMLSNWRTRGVICNNYFAETYCVLIDNYHGISGLLDVLESRGCRNIFFCTKHFVNLGMANMSERAYAFRNECERRSLKYRILTDGNQTELMNLVTGRKTCPDAVMFSCDSEAVRFREKLPCSGVRKLPVVAGFDGVNVRTGLPPEGILTWKIDYSLMGRAAVDVMMNNTFLDWVMPDVVRVRGTLMDNTES